MLLANDKRWFDFTYFLGTGGAIFALFSPDVGSYNFPHFVFIQTMLVHGLLLTSQIYLAAVEGWRPSNRAVLKVLVFINVYMVFIFVFNQLTGSNYLFIAYKPDFPSLIDHLGPWPWYLVSIEAVGMAVIFLLRLPFTRANPK
jgi:hypothetical integral membrane protein (TIGR02206 family)